MQSAFGVCVYNLSILGLPTYGFVPSRVSDVVSYWGIECWCGMECFYPLRYLFVAWPLTSNYSIVNKSISPYNICVEVKLRHHDIVNADLEQHSPFDFSILHKGPSYNHHFSDAGFLEGTWLDRN